MPTTMLPSRLKPRPFTSNPASQPATLPMTRNIIKLCASTVKFSKCVTTPHSRPGRVDVIAQELKAGMIGGARGAFFSRLALWEVRSRRCQHRGRALCPCGRKISSWYRHIRENGYPVFSGGYWIAGGAGTMESESPGLRDALGRGDGLRRTIQQQRRIYGY